MKKIFGSDQKYQQIKGLFNGGQYAHPQPPEQTKSQVRTTVNESRGVSQGREAKQRNDNPFSSMNGNKPPQFSQSKSPRPAQTINAPFLK